MTGLRRRQRVSELLPQSPPGLLFSGVTAGPHIGKPGKKRNCGSGRRENWKPDRQRARRCPSAARKLSNHRWENGSKDGNLLWLHARSVAAKTLGHHVLPRSNALPRESCAHLLCDVFTAAGSAMGFL